MPPWLRTPLGEYLIAWEQARLDAMIADIFGYNALQVGLAEVDLLQASRMPLRVACAAQNGVSRAPSCVVCDEAALPFASASLDLVVLAHELEFSATPHQLLREAARVLVAEGSVVVCGFNPYSLWGLRRLVRGQPAGMEDFAGAKDFSPLHGSRVGDRWPWHGRYLSAPKVRDWLTVLGFEVQSSQFGCYAPAVESPEWLRRWKWLDRVGRRCWPICGAVWVLHGIKRVHGARLIQPNWREKRAPAKGLSAVARKLGESGGLSGETGPGET